MITLALTVFVWLAQPANLDFVAPPDRTWPAQGALRHHPTYWQQSAHVLAGHEDRLRFVAFSPDGSRVITGAQDATARIWDVESGALVAVLEGHARSVRFAAYSPDGTRIVTGSADKSARLWDAQSGAALCVFEPESPSGFSGRVDSAAFSGDGRLVVTALTSDRANAVRVWDTQSCAQVATLDGHSDRLFEVAASPDGTLFASTSHDGTARIWEAATGAARVVLKGHSGPVWFVRFSPDGRRVVTSGVDGTARIWDVHSGEERVAFTHPFGYFLEDPVFSPGGDLIASVDSGRMVLLWRARTGTMVHRLDHPDLVTSAAFSPDGTLLITTSDNPVARIWDVQSGRLLAELDGHSGDLIGAVFSPDGMRVVTASEDGTARIWGQR